MPKTALINFLLHIYYGISRLTYIYNGIALINFLLYIYHDIARLTFNNYCPFLSARVSYLHSLYHMFLRILPLLLPDALVQALLLL